MNSPTTPPPSLPPLPRWATILLIANAIITLALAKIIWDQNRRIQTLERNDTVNQSLHKLESNYNSLKNRLEGVFH